MKINRRNFLVLSSSAALLAQNIEPVLGQSKKSSKTAAKPFSVEARKVTVYTTAQNSEYRITATDTLSFKQMGQPLESQICVFVDPSKTYQTFLGFGGALTDAAAETYAKLPADKQQEMYDRVFQCRSRSRL